MTGSKQSVARNDVVPRSNRTSSHYGHVLTQTVLKSSDFQTIFIYIIRTIKLGIRLAGEMRNAFKILVGNPEGRGLQERIRRRWKDIKMLKYTKP
jgi:hypothetical protein